MLAVMRLRSGQHLCYCTNVHPYADLAGLRAALVTHASVLRERLASGDEPFGVGLWFPADVAAAVARDPGPLRRTLDELRLETRTLNAFPAGAFHGDRVKDEVFRPTWAERARLVHTLDAAEALAALLPEDAVGSISTHSGGYKGWSSPPTPEAVAAGWLAAAQGLARIEERTGRHIVLAIEPEPFSLLETTDEVVTFFTEHLLPAGEWAGRHLGLCYDACHQAVEHEDMAVSVGQLRAAGITIAKVQLSSALVVPDPVAAAERLRAFAEDRWFHQVIEQRADGSLRRIADLPEALDELDALRHGDADAGGAAQTGAGVAVGPWRIHFHVPIFAEQLDDEGLLLTTRPWLEQLLAEVGDAEVTPHLEIETYSFELIPPDRRATLGTVELLDALEAEYRWVLAQLPRA